MTAIDTSTDAITGNTVVTITWSDGECIQYTIAPNPDADPDDYLNSMSYNVYITGYACPEDGVEFSQWDISDETRAELATQCDTMADAIEYCTIVY